MNNANNSQHRSPATLHYALDKPEGSLLMLLENSVPEAKFGLRSTASPTPFEHLLSLVNVLLQSQSLDLRLTELKTLLPVIHTDLLSLC